MKHAIWTWKKHLCFDISSANIDTLVSLLYQFVETSSIEVSRSLLHFVSTSSSAKRLPWRWNCFTWQKKLPNINRKHFFMNILCTEPFCPQKTHNRLLLFDSTLKNGHHFDYWNQPLNMRICCLDSWSWTVLLPSDTHRKPVTSLTVVLLLFVTYLLTLPHIYYKYVIVLRFFVYKSSFKNTI
jgi:hypothetical protein